MYTPAGNVLQGNANLEHSFVGGNPALYIHYFQTRGLDTLQKKFVFGKTTVKDDMPKQSGNTIQWYRYQELAANTNPVGAAAEGSVGTSLALRSNTITATLSQYMDYVSFSDRLIITSIDDRGIIENAVDRMSYRAAFTLDTITRAEIDSVAAGDRTASLLSGTVFSVSDVRNTRAWLQGRDIQPMQEGECKGYFMGILHPNITFDLINDPLANGVTDLVKYTESNPFGEMPDRGQVFQLGGVKFWESTNVFEAAGPPATYRVYIFGYNGVGSSTVAGRKPTEVYDPKKHRFNLMVGSNLSHSVANPTASIGGYVSYNFMYVAKVLVDGGNETVPRYAYFDSETTAT